MCFLPNHLPCQMALELMHVHSVATNYCIHTLSLARSLRGRVSGDSTFAASASLSSSRFSHNTISNALLTCVHVYACARACVCVLYYVNAADQTKYHVHHNLTGH